ncbi:MAG: hypothetical protein RLZZ558_1559 [Planctomycetota bacterium]
MSAAPAAVRPWERMAGALRERLAEAPDRSARMQALVQACWPHLAPTGVSWIGFYHRDPDHPGQLVLGAREPKPACSPIGLHGACGQSLRTARPLVVRDVAELGAGYIACDPNDRSEVVVPCLDADGSAWGVLDLDSHHLASFGPEDAEQLARLLKLAGLSL